MRAAVFSLVVVAAACSDGSADAASARCDDAMRVAGDEMVVKSVGRDGVVATVPAECARMSCLRTREDAVAVLQPDGTAWAAWAGRPGALVVGDVAPDAADAERWARVQVLASARGAPPADAAVDDGAPPALPKELRTCGTTRAGGGFGWHVIRNRGDVWQRIHWSKPPVDEDVRALPVTAYPVATSAGALCGWGVQTAERTWRVTHKASGVVVDAKPDLEHAPAACADDGAIVVQTGTGAVRVARDGTTSTVHSDPQAVAELPVGASATLARPRGSVRIATPGGQTATLALPEATDLGGEPLPAGAVRDKIIAVGDGADRLLVVERFTLPSCNGREAMHFVRSDGVVEKTIARGDVVTAKLSRAAGRWWWVEAEPKIVALAGDAFKSAARR